MTKPTVREACRQRLPLDGTDAQALEHALTMTEQERDGLLDGAQKLLVALHEAEATAPDGSGHLNRLVTLQLAEDALRATIAKLPAAVRRGRC
jgi:hypothetical protein